MSSQISPNFKPFEFASLRVLKDSFLLKLDIIKESDDFIIFLKKKLLYQFSSQRIYKKLSSEDQDSLAQVIETLIRKEQSSWKVSGLIDPLNQIHILISGSSGIINIRHFISLCATLAILIERESLDTLNYVFANTLSRDILPAPYQELPFSFSLRASQNVLYDLPLVSNSTQLPVGHNFVFPVFDEFAKSNPSNVFTDPHYIRDNFSTLLTNFPLQKDFNLLIDYRDHCQATGFIFLVDSFFYPDLLLKLKEVCPKFNAVMLNAAGCFTNSFIEFLRTSQIDIPNLFILASGIAATHSTDPIYIDSGINQSVTFGDCSSRVFLDFVANKPQTKLTDLCPLLNRDPILKRGSEYHYFFTCFLGSATGMKGLTLGSFYGGEKVAASIGNRDRDDELDEQILCARRLNQTSLLPEAGQTISIHLLPKILSHLVADAGLSRNQFGLICSKPSDTDFFRFAQAYEQIFHSHFGFQCFQEPYVIMIAFFLRKYYSLESKKSPDQFRSFLSKSDFH